MGVDGRTYVPCPVVYPRGYALKSPVLACFPWSWIYLTVFPFSCVYGLILPLALRLVPGVFLLLSVFALDGGKRFSSGSLSK